MFDVYRLDRAGDGNRACGMPRGDNVKPADSGYSYYHFPEGENFAGKAVPASYYVPVDYEKVDGLSNAVEKRWSLRGIYEPESIYGKVI
jgi:hypothetical protein